MALKVNQGKLDWTPEMTARLVDLWGKGVSTSQMARLLGDTVTKNAVIGKVHRLRLPMRKSPIGTHPPGVRRLTRHHRKAKIAAKAPPSTSLPLPVPDSPPKPKPPPRPPCPPPRMPPGGWTLLDLVAGQCKWPVNEPPKGGEYHFCGKPQFNSLPYCEYHARLGFSGKGTARATAKAGWIPKQVGF